MEAIRGTITKFSYRHPGSGWKIAKFLPAGTLSEITIKGEIAESNIDTDVEIRGDFVENGTYGREFQVSNIIRSAPTDKKSIEKWLKDNINGVGPGMAKKIVDKFDDQLRQVIEFEPAKMSEIKGVSKETALRINMEWVKDAADREMQLLLSQADISDTLAKKVVRMYGSNAVQIVQDNPYKLTRVNGIGFKTADKMAFNIGWSAQRPERLTAAITYLLQEAVTDGHSFLHRHELVEQTCRLAEITDEAGKTQLLPEIEAVRAIERAIDNNQVKLQPLTINGVNYQLCYLPEYYDLEVEVAKRIANLALTPHAPPQNIGKVLAKVEKELQLTLSDQQRDGVLSAIGNNISIITGLPGTGKTSTVRALVNTARNLGLAVQLAAPTGRAAKRLSEVTNLEALTIHRLLKYDPAEGGFVFNENNKLACNMLILDEASMIDLELMADLLRAVPDDCSVVWIGDVNQLPSVGAGTVLRDLINSKRIHTTVLDKIFRQAEGSLVIQNAHRIHRGEMPQFPPKGTDGDSFWIPVPRTKSEKTGQSTDDIEFIKEMLPQIYDRLQTKYGYDPISDIQVLMPMRKGPAGYHAFNDSIQQAVNPDGARIEVAGQVFRVGDRVMQTKNNYALEIFNGDVGHIREVKYEDKALLIEWSDGESLYPFENVPELSLSYAVSIHKSQGSEFPVVIIVMVNHHYTMLERNLIYTANTRAKKMCIYLSSKSAMETAVKTQKVLRRNSLLTERIKKAVGVAKKPVAAA